MILTQPLIALSLIAASAQVAPPRVAMINWDALAPMPWRVPPQVLPTMSTYVRGALQTGKCPPPPVVAGRATIRVDVAVMLTEEGDVRATIPRAIQCTLVEQYAAGLVTSFARNNLMLRSDDASGWYRASVTFDWPNGG